MLVPKIKLSEFACIWLKDRKPQSMVSKKPDFNQYEIRSSLAFEILAF